MSTPEPKTSIILCEGMTDGYLLGYFLTEVCGYKEIENPNHRFVKLRKRPHQLFNYYEKSSEKSEGAVISSVVVIGNGNDNFKLSSELVINLVANDRSAKLIQNFLIVADRDAKTDSQLLEHFSDCLGVKKYELDVNPLKIGEWVKINVPSANRQSNPGDKEIALRVHVVILPPDNEKGAIEKFILDSLAEKDLVDSARKFSKNSEIEHRYPKKTDQDAKDRMKEKAALGSAFAVLSPSHILTEIRHRIMTINWQELPDMKNLRDLLNSLEKSDE